MSKEFQSSDSFVSRHIGPSDSDVQKMLKTLGFSSLEKFIESIIPSNIRTPTPLQIGPEKSEFEILGEMRVMASKNQVFRNYIGMGYSDCITPSVILRNIMENPGWYTHYTPYQAEIAQGRLQALLNFQTMVSDLTGLPMANASLLDEGTAAAEAMSLCMNVSKNSDAKYFFVSELCHPQTIEVVKTRAKPLGIDVVVGDHEKFSFDQKVFGVLLQFPTSDGRVFDYSLFVQKAHDHGALVVVAADILSLTLLKPPGEWGADIAVGSTQRFGVPLGYGGPHAAYISTKDEFKRQIPGRIVGVSVDAQGNQALRLALQTREQHIRRAKATSNICTAQVLLAVMASMYGVYHGPRGLKKIAQRINNLTTALASVLEKSGFKIQGANYFDTLKVSCGTRSSKEILARAIAKKINFRLINESILGISLDETTTEADVGDVVEVFTGRREEIKLSASTSIPDSFARKSEYMAHPVFNSYHSETELLRYRNKLQSRDLSLTMSMIPLGSCTMKLNATAEMIPVTWSEFGRMHPFAPLEQAGGYMDLVSRLEKMLSDITGFEGISLQPNAGSQGEYAGLLVIKKYFESKGEGHRNVCLIPNSAHGTNPASAVMAGLKIIGVECDEKGNIIVEDLRTKAQEYRSHLAALMVTYPSTHGVFEESIVEICEIIHENGGQVYMDGANMNAQVGLCRPAEFGADVCHLNLHKTFCIPHGGGGPGMGPIGVKKHLTAFLPSHPVIKMGGENAVSAVSAAPWGSASILPISYIYIVLMGSVGLKRATEIAILNANYVARRLEKYYPVLFKGRQGLVAHECIIDLRGMKKVGVEVFDVAKRLMDYGLHAPTVSWPVAGTMMVEPTESESLRELDRFCDAMISIYKEVEDISAGRTHAENNLLKNAPHTAAVIASDKWDRPYSREAAVFPTPWTRESKFWPTVSRINDPYGDKNMVCACPPVTDY